MVNNTVVFFKIFVNNQKLLFYSNKKNWPKKFGLIK